LQLLGLLLLGLFLPCTSRPQPKHQIRTPEEWKQEKERRDRTLEVEFVLLLPLGEIVLLGHLQFLPSPPTRQEKRGQRRQSRRSDQTLANNSHLLLLTLPWTVVAGLGSVLSENGPALGLTSVGDLEAQLLHAAHQSAGG